MLHTVKTLTQYSTTMSSLDALEQLKRDYGIKFSLWAKNGVDRLVVLNYDQINSNKILPITIECRSLVLAIGTWEIVSRSFDRFLNLGEGDTPSEGWVNTPLSSPSRLRNLTYHEKMDGSLIGVFVFEGEVLYRTRSVIMPEGDINGFDMTWKQRIEGCLPTDTDFYASTLKQFTVICELICPENRVVVDYKGESRLVILAVRENSTEGEYLNAESCDSLADFIGVTRPKTFTFNSVEDCVKAAAELPNLEEGYVGYNPAGIPCVKVKSPAYVAAHHLRGEGLNEKRILDLIIINEADEYLTLFPDDEKMFKPYKEAFMVFGITMSRLVGFLKCKAVEAKSQKDFALFFKDFPEASLIFNIRKGQEWRDAFGKLSKEKQRSLVMEHYE